MHMGHLAMRVTDPGRSADHLSATLGLRRTYGDDREIGLSANERHHEVQLIAAAAAGLDHVGIEVEEERDLDRLRDALIADGAPILAETPQEPGMAEAIRVQGPEDLVLELYTGMARDPLSVEHYMLALARRFGHVNIATRDRAESQRFLCDVLGFRVSDTLGATATTTASPCAMPMRTPCTTTHSSSRTGARSSVTPISSRCSASA